MTTLLKRQIKEEIKKQILADNNLSNAFASYLGIRVYNLPQALRRNTKATTQVDAILFLSKLLHKTTEDILT